MNDKTINLLKDFGGEIKEVLHQMALALGVAAEHVYIVLIKQQFVWGIIYCLWPLLAIPVALILTRYFIRNAYSERDSGKFGNPHSYDSTLPGFIGFLMAAIYVLWIPLVICSIVSIVHGIAHMVNPEYYALKQIIDFIDQMKNGPAPVGRR